MYEMFGTGTACVVAPVDRILYKNPSTGDFEEMIIPTMIHKPNLMQKLYQTVIDIQVFISSLEKTTAYLIYLNSTIMKLRYTFLSHNKYIFNILNAYYSMEK